MKESIEKLVSKGQFVNYNDVNSVVQEFLSEKKETVTFYCKNAYGDVNSVSLAAFKEVLKEELKNGLISFINSDHQITDDGVRNYLSLCVKQCSVKVSKQDRKNIHVCPGCKYLNRITSVEYRTGTSSISEHRRLFFCGVCQKDLNSGENPEKINLYTTFALHSRSGYRCLDCERFIPHPQMDNIILSCPYPDCMFSGKLSELETMRHPTIKGTQEMLILNASFDKDGGGASIVDHLTDNGMSDKNSDFLSKSSNTTAQMIVREDVDNQMKVLLKTISDQKTAIAYRSNDSTLLLKTLMYNAYESIISQYPEEMLAYLVHQTRNGGLQHKIFQEFIRLLEGKLPYRFIKNGKSQEIKSIRDPSLCIFTGESVFLSKVNQDLTIDNKTEEIYVGSRKGFYCKPYYLGKLLEVCNQATGQDVTSDVEEYSFFRIKMKQDTVNPGTQVQIRHLRVPPHYQMGGMVHVNRIRRTIVDKIYLTINGRKREPMNNAGKEDDDD